MTRFARYAPALALALLAACATNEPSPHPRTEYQVGADGPRRARAAAERAHAAAAAPATAKTLDSLDADVAPKLLASHFPDYPRKLQDAGIEGRVVVRFIVETDGSVGDAQVQGTPPPELAALTLAAIRRWRFAPAVKDGTPVRTRLQQPFLFRIE